MNNRSTNAPTIINDSAISLINSLSLKNLIIAIAKMND